MFIALIETDEINISTEHDTFVDALKTANEFANSKDYGKIYDAQIFKSDKAVMGSENIKTECKLVASLRTIK